MTTLAGPSAAAGPRRDPPKMLEPSRARPQLPGGSRLRRLAAAPAVNELTPVVRPGVATPNRRPPQYLTNTTKRPGANGYCSRPIKPCTNNSLRDGTTLDAPITCLGLVATYQLHTRWPLVASLSSGLPVPVVASSTGSSTASPERPGAGTTYRRRDRTRCPSAHTHPHRRSSVRPRYPQKSQNRLYGGSQNLSRPLTRLDQSPRILVAFRV